MALFIGLMSGTSMDGIDAALIDLSSNTFIKGITCQYSDELKRKLNTALLHNQSLGYYSQLNTLIGREFAQAVLQLLAMTGLKSSDITAIGSHGQTLCHDTTPEIPYTVQLGCAHTIAALTKITVVADFRTRDLVVGGQGAPFAPIYHQAIFKNQTFPLAVVNVGGISNLTYLENAESVSGYDVGPGNCLMDAWISKHLKKDYDHNGDWALSGNHLKPLLENLLKDPYFQRLPPKSIGKEYFSLDWLNRYPLTEYAPCDVQATLLQLTALSIVHATKALPLPPSHLFLCGGGAHNQNLLDTLSYLLPEMVISSTESVHINPDFIEALMFAWLAQKTLDKIPIDLKHITGASSPTVLGAIYPH